MLIGDYIVVAVRPCYDLYFVQSSCCCWIVFFFSCYGDHRDLHVLTHSFPTRRSSDLFEALTDDETERIEGMYADNFGAPKLRSEEHTSELQSLMRISYAVFCLKKKNNRKTCHSR